MSHSSATVDSKVDVTTLHHKLVLELLECIWNKDVHVEVGLQQL